MVLCWKYTTRSLIWPRALQDSLLTDTYTKKFLPKCRKIGHAGTNEQVGLEAGGCDAGMGLWWTTRPSA